MNTKSPENLRAIRFAGELLPNWAQRLDLAAKLSPVSEETRRWFSGLTRHSGVDDARTVLHHCTALLNSIQSDPDTIAAGLRRNHGEIQPPQILCAWTYALDTMIQATRNRKTCPWIVEGEEDSEPDRPDDGDITLRRV